MTCRTCNGTRWVCEEHPDRPWGGLCCKRPDGADICEHGACHCGGAGDPCPSCNPEGEIDPGWVHTEATVYDDPPDVPETTEEE